MCVCVCVCVQVCLCVAFLCCYLSIVYCARSRELQPSKETLHTFKQEMLSREAADKQKAAGVGEGFGGFGGFGDG